MRVLSLKISCLLIFITACRQKVETIQIGENTFVHQEKVFRVIENQITELGNLNSDSLAKSTVLSQKLKDFGRYNMDYVKPGAATLLSGVYRGDIFYFRAEVFGLNDLTERYSGGGLTFDFLDEFGFQIQTITVLQNELTRIVGDNDKTLYFQYYGKTQMSSEVYRSLASYSVSSSLRKKGAYGR